MPAETGIVDSTLSLIVSANLTPTEHSLLKGFVTEARIADSKGREIEEVLRDIKHDWKQLVLKFTTRDGVPTTVEDLVRHRDGPYCCVSSLKDKSLVKGFSRPEAAWVIPPRIFEDDQMTPEGSIFSVLKAFLTPANMLEMRSILSSREGVDELRNLWLLSPSIHSAIRNGHIRILPLRSAGNWTDAAENQHDNAKTADYFAYRLRPEALTKLYLSDGSPFPESAQTFTMSTDDPIEFLLLSNVLLRIRYRISSALHLFSVEQKIAAGWPRPSLLTLSKPAQRLMRRCWHYVPKLLRLWSYRIMRQLGKYLYPSNDSLVIRRLPFGLYQKTCARSQRNEVRALQLVEEHTTISAPLWIDDFEEQGNTILVMTRLEGQMLHSVFHRLSYPERNQLSQDLKEMICQLRTITNQTPYLIGNTLGGALVDHRAGTCGPFKGALEFNKHLACEYPDPDAQRAFEPVHSRQHKSYSTHADLHSTNILMSQGRLAGIVDWKCAGYWPEYWEYTKAIYGIINNKELEKVARDAFDEDYEDELRLEKLLWLASPFGLQ
ncbi:kinase-like domain-containing protein [Aspergillus crustosus]